LSAAASEFNKGSVVSDPETKEKLATGFNNSPVASAIDPTVQLTLPWRQVMCGAVDSFSHLLETYFSKPNTNITTRQINLALQKSIIKAMERIKKDVNDVDARTNFVWAVSVALNSIAGFQMSQDWNVHYIEHAVSAFDDKIAHAEGLAVVSLAYYPFLYEKGLCAEMFQEWAETVFGTKDVKEALQKLKELFVFWETPQTLKDLHIEEKDIATIVKIERGHHSLGLESTLFPLTAADVEQILRLAL
jgi:alcohol dehydrogenase YqhD (iron-dependent ADH family)